MPKACIVPNCWKTFKNDTRKCSVFKVPQDEELRRKWEVAIPGIRELKTSQHVCERHFQSQSIVRNLVKRGPDGQILIDIPYKCPRLLKSVVPSIFGEDIPVHHQETDKQNKPVDATEYAVEIEIDVENRVIDQSCKEEPMDFSLLHAQEKHYTFEFVSTYEADQHHCLADETSKETESDATSKDLNMKFFTTSETRIRFTTFNGDCEVSLPNNWSIRGSSMQQKFLSVSQIVINKDVSVIRKGIVIDEKGQIKYAVHGKALKHQVPGLSQQLHDPQILPKILRDFDVLRVCNGLGDEIMSIAEAGTTYTDMMNVNRSTKCFLVGRKKTCSSCARLRKTLRQKDFRCKSRLGMKRFSTPSNNIDEKKLKAMRLKINPQLRR